MTQRTAIVESHGFKWVLGGPETDDHLVIGHEEMLIPLLANYAREDKVSIVVGAHVGLHVLPLTHHSKHVQAVEANPKTFERLEENITLNNLQNKVTAINAVAWDVDDDIVMLTDELNKETGGSTRAEEYRVLPRGYEKRAFRTTALDTFNFTDVGLVTLDVEGAEAHVLRGAKRLLKATRPILIIELHEGHPGTDEDLRQQVYDVLDELDYEYSSIELTGERLICVPSEQSLPDVKPAEPTHLRESSIDDSIALLNLFEGE